MLGGLETPRVVMVPDTSVVGGMRVPLKVLSTQLPKRDIGQSSPYPGATNTITATLQFNLDVDSRHAKHLPDATHSFAFSLVILRQNVFFLHCVWNCLGRRTCVALSEPWRETPPLPCHHPPPLS